MMNRMVKHRLFLWKDKIYDVFHLYKLERVVGYLMGRNATRRSRIKDSINWPLFSSAETCRIDIERLIYLHCTPPAQLSCVSQFTRPLRLTCEFSILHTDVTINWTRLYRISLFDSYAFLSQLVATKYETLLSRRRK